MKNEDANISIMNDSSILIAKHKTSYTLNKIRSVIEKVFPENEDLSIKMPLADYRKIAAEAQEKLNADSIIKDIVTEIKSTLEEYVDGNELLFQSNLYLRCSRPLNPSSQESIEILLGIILWLNMEHSINVDSSQRCYQRKYPALHTSFARNT